MASVRNLRYRISLSGLDEGTVAISGEPDVVSSAEAWPVAEIDAFPGAVNVAVLCAEAAFPPHD